MRDIVFMFLLGCNLARIEMIENDEIAGTSDRQSTWMFLLVCPTLLWLCRASRVDLSLNEPETTAV